MFYDSAHPHQSSFDTHESRLRFGMRFAELWHEWFDTMSHVAYQTHRACEFRPSHNPSDGSDGSVDMDKLRHCLHEMEPAQAARVIHAVQTMQAMEAMLKRKRSRASEAEEPAW